MIDSAVSSTSRNHLTDARSRIFDGLESCRCDRVLSLSRILILLAPVVIVVVLRELRYFDNVLVQVHPYINPGLVRSKPRSPVALNRSREDRKSPTIMIGVMMADIPISTWQRKILRQIFPPEEVALYFPICRPSADTMKERDVVPIDMPENINLGKTQRWFWYAQKHRPSSVRAIFKMDTDSLFCLEDLKALLSDKKGSYEYYGRFFNHYSCFEHACCPPKTCSEVRTMTGHCWYYMQGGFYGISSQLLDRLTAVPIFKEPQGGELHEDIVTAHWLNQSVLRTEIIERGFDFHHSKSLVDVSPLTYLNFYMSYAKALQTLNCKTQLSTALENSSAARDRTP
jgi:hypothetical protein